MFIFEAITRNPELVESAYISVPVSQFIWFSRIINAFDALAWTAVYSIKFSFLCFFKLLISQLTIIRRYWNFVCGLCIVCAAFSVCNIFIAGPHGDVRISTRPNSYIRCLADIWFLVARCVNDLSNKTQLAMIDLSSGPDILTDVLS